MNAAAAADWWVTIIVALIAAISGVYGAKQSRLARKQTSDPNSGSLRQIVTEMRDELGDIRGLVVTAGRASERMEVNQREQGQALAAVIRRVNDIEALAHDQKGP